MNFNSPNGLDRLIWSILGEHGIDIGFAVEAGAYNGIVGSHTLGLEQEGWKVLCVEANPLLEPEGRENRKLWRAVAVGATNTESVDFWYYTTGGAAPGYPSNHLASHSAVAVDGRVPYLTEPPPESQRIKIPMRTLDSLLDEVGFPRLDVAVLDLEGGESEAIKGFSLERWKPTVLTIESNDGHITKPHGYTQVAHIEVDYVFVRDKESA